MKNVHYPKHIVKDLIFWCFSRVSFMINPPWKNMTPNKKNNIYKFIYKT